MTSYEESYDSTALMGLGEFDFNDFLSKYKWWLVGAGALALGAGAWFKFGKKRAQVSVGGYHYRRRSRRRR